MSKPLQVYLAERDMKDLEAWAKRRGWTKSEAIRAAVRALVRPDEDPILSLSGIAKGLPSDASVNFNKYFAETFVGERPAPYRAKRRRASTPVRR
jgi:hypothetical protein